MEDFTKKSDDDPIQGQRQGGNNSDGHGNGGEVRHNHKHKKKSSKKKKSGKDTQHHSDSGKSSESGATYEDKIQAKQRAVAQVGSTFSRSGGDGSGGRSAVEHSSVLDARIEAKRAANLPLVANSTERSDSHIVNQRSEDYAPSNNRVGGVQEPLEDNEEELLLFADMTDYGQEREGSERNIFGAGDAGDIPHHQEVEEEEEIAYPDVQADIAVMEEIHQEGLVDEAGGIQAYIAEPEIISGDVIGVIKSDEEVEREERRVYTKYFVGASVCMVFLIIIIGVPVTLKLTNVISPTVVLTAEPTISPTCMPSEAPSSAPTSEYFTQVVEKLIPLSGNALYDPQTPQHKAARWISDVDQMDLNHPGFEQRYAMAVFYYSTDGDNWQTQDGWLKEGSECNWHGIQGLGNCLEGCTNDGDICGITMKYNRISGSIPSEMGILTQMRYFEIQNNVLTGTIPTEIGNWNKLSAFLVNWNKLEGTFPITFAPNNRLGTIFVNGNRLKGDSLVSSLSILKNLEWLEARENDLTGTLSADIANLNRLDIIDLRNNSLTGTIPNNWNETHMISSLMVSHNNITGRLPDTLGRVPRLRKLHISGNEMTGSIPVSYYNLSSLEELYLDDNNFYGGLPQTPEPIYENMEEFSIHDNAFSGRFPAEYFESSKLKLLSLHRNQLTGTITETICERTDTSQANSIRTLTADCDMIICDCCTKCY
mmetsp:Transcript_26969/g.56758  ORF Transcript_26969/g.56758 Transcript_26969/m.56758 type:complete len:708 (+) Transcript_26969:166-2289(+)|eukprot:CAMPEP_0171344976 /NCGR_PEP_ID=MMETSP0878-20121228/20603_1 /TAXON_ID=67004 /ORGANISM="Thalassiosira weissflogii, Strain CCMP1336" /LENGTH=707 /DNA_ID=CAMNT_0011848289 /DNA_START=105 /DNA_END=2228 /DNA_ORIENTATION=-